MRQTVLAPVLVLLSTALYAAKRAAEGPLPSADDYTVIAGKVTIGTIDAHLIGVLVDDGGPYRHLFRLWTESPLKTFRASSQSASIEFRGDELVVLASDQEWFYAPVPLAADPFASRVWLFFSSPNSPQLFHHLMFVMASNRHSSEIASDVANSVKPEQRNKIQHRHDNLNEATPGCLSHLHSFQPARNDVTAAAWVSPAVIIMAKQEK